MEVPVFSSKLEYAVGPVSLFDPGPDLFVEKALPSCSSFPPLQRLQDRLKFIVLSQKVCCVGTSSKWLYTLPRDEKSSDPKGWIRAKIGPVLEATTSYLQGKYGVEM